METDNLTVAGRRFRNRADYQAALQEQQIIDEIRSKVNFQNPGDVYELYRAIQSGKYRFTTILGKDFDDEVYEMIAKYSKHTKQKAEATTGFQNYSKEMQQEILKQLRKQEHRRRVIVIICSLLAVVCFGYFGVYYFYTDRTTTDYDALISIKNSAQTEGVPDDNKVIVHKTGDIEMPDILPEYQTLYSKNNRLIGWIKIDDTNIDYPVMQTVNNEYYLTYNFDQEYDKNGSIFLDYNCSVYPRSTNLIIYGHHMKSGAMFGQLQKYASEDYYEKHKVIQFDTLYDKGTYEVVYVFRSKVFNENEIVFKYYQFIDAKSETEFDSYMKEMEQMSLYDTGVKAAYGDQLLSLSTCDNSQSDGRFVVVARRTD